MAEGSRFFIGNQTAFSVPWSEPFAFALANGFEAFELFPDGGAHGRGFAIEDVPPAERRALRAAARTGGVRLSVHAALAARPFDPEGGARLARDITFARDVGARVLNLHLDAGDPDGFARAMLGARDQLAASDITLALENTVTTGPEEVNRCFSRLRTLGYDGARGIGLCLDIGHANLCRATHHDYLAFVDRLEPDVPIVHAHLHENWGDADRHLPLFTGPAGRDPSGIAGLLARLHQRSYQGSLILEQWPTPPTLLVAARDRLRALQRP
jgi:sugar phosphate isomerase/epimerase